MNILKIVKEFMLHNEPFLDHEVEPDTIRAAYKYGKDVIMTRTIYTNMLGQPFRSVVVHQLVFDDILVWENRNSYGPIFGARTNRQRFFIKDSKVKEYLKPIQKELKLGWWDEFKKLL